MKSSFPKRDKHYSKKKMGLQSQVHRSCFGKGLFTYVYMRIYSLYIAMEYIYIYI